MPFKGDKLISGYFPYTTFVLEGEKKNKKQIEFFNVFLESLKKFQENPDALEHYRYMSYGGAVRGGKSFLISFIIHVLSVNYPGSIWVIVRKNLPRLKKTSVTTYHKMLGHHNIKRHGRFIYSMPMQFKYWNGSHVYFLPENIQADPMLNSFDGFECNGFFLEQVEELAYKMYEVAKERAGSHYLQNMPPAFVFTTMNPNNLWSKKEIYDKYQAGQLHKPHYYLEALPSDNPHVTKEQWDNWKFLDDRNYKMRILSDWSITMLNDNRFIYAFKREKHLKPPDQQEPLNPYLPLYLSFDFNVNPMTCIVGQHDVHFTKVRFLKEYRIPNASIYEVCDKIKNDFGGRIIYVTGDPAGWSRDSRARGANCHYDIICRELHINQSNILAPKGHPYQKVTRTLANSLLDKHHDFKFNDMPFLINDIETVEANEEGGIKKLVGENGHLLDAFLYYCFTFGRKYLGIVSV